VRKDNAPVSAEQKARDMIVSEIASTEKAYIDNLSVALKVE
jgi:hypothetical protein